MKSPHFHDPVRLEVVDAHVHTASSHDEIEVTVTFKYQPWEPSAAQDVLMEKANALTCLRQAFLRGGIGDEW